jgi:hypothetical protein
MPADDELAELAAQIGAFHITDRGMKQAQQRFEAALRNDSLDDRARAEYVAAARRYFEGFDREARAHLHEVDRRLEHVNQVHFNLTAERGVAVKRIEATTAVLQKLALLTGIRA